MTPAKLAEYVRIKTRTNSTTFNDANMVAIANVVKDKLVLEALDADEDLFLVPTYMNLVADQREYPLLSTIMSRIKRVEAALDGSNWLKLNEFDLPQFKYPLTTEEDITTYFQNAEGSAYFDLMRKAITIYSGTITDVTNGLRIWLNTWVADLTNVTSTDDMSIDPSATTHGIPRALHNVMATGVVIEYKESREKPIPLNESELNYEMEIRRAVAKLKRGDYDRQVQGTVPYDDGQEY